jgi:hypothetical protein
LGHSTFLKVITTVSAYIKLLEPTPVTKWVNWTKLGHFWAKFWPNWIGVPILIVETCTFGSRHRFECYDCPQRIYKVTLRPYQHPDGQLGGCRVVLQYGSEILALSELF